MEDPKSGRSDFQDKDQMFYVISIEIHVITVLLFLFINVHPVSK